MSLILSENVELGEGWTGFVLRGTFNCQPVAVKQCFDPSTLEYEASLLERCCHENVVKFVEFVEKPNGSYLIMELAVGGTLQQHLGRDRFTLAEKQSLVQQLCSGLNHIHSRGIVHCDITADNLLFRDDRQSHLVIADFGNAECTFSSRPILNSQNVVKDRFYTYSSDIFLLGITVFQFLKDWSSVDRSTLGCLILELAETNRVLDGRIFKNPRWADTIVASVSRNPDSRPKVAEFQAAFSKHA